MEYPERFISDILPKTMEEIQAAVREKNRREFNFSNLGSEIEHDFLHGFYKVKAEDASIKGQEKCVTRLGNFRMDFVITKGRRRIAFECDGKDYHDKNKDKLRDEAILETGFVDTIYRSPGRSLWFPLLARRDARTKRS